MDKRRRPTELTINESEAWFKIEKECTVPEVKCGIEDRSILLWVTVSDGDNEIQGLQYLTPEIALKMSKRLREMALNLFELSV